MQRMAAADAASYWMSERIPNDQFLLYCFAAPSIPTEETARRLVARAGGVEDLCLRVHDVPAGADRPYWVRAAPTEDQVRVDTTTRTWSSLLDTVAGLVGDPLVPTDAAWRLHLFGSVTGVPTAGADEVNTVVVLQISHALGDGRRVSQTARDLFDAPPARRDGRRDDPVPGPIRDAATVALGLARLPIEFLDTMRRGVEAARLAGRATPGPGYPLTHLNTDPGPKRALRVLVLDRHRLTAAGHPVTTAVLTAISRALPEYLGEHADRLGVELTVGRTGEPDARNHFRNVGIDLHLDVDDLDERARLIREEIVAARDADTDPARVAQRRATQATPAILARWGVRGFDLQARPATVTGVTVVSSVHRGAADLELDGGKVLFTTGFPALSPVQGLTHGVHGLGDRVAVSVTTSPKVMPDVDRYVALLDGALGRGRE